MVLSSSVHLIHRAWRRVVDIPKRGLPILHSEPAHAGFDQEYGVETSKLVWLTNVSSHNYVHGISTKPVLQSLASGPSKLRALIIRTIGSWTSVVEKDVRY